MAQRGNGGASGGTPRWLLNAMGVLIMVMWATIVAADVFSDYEANPLAFGLPAIAGTFFGVSLVKR